ncbi:MAG: protein kinase [Planctomycetota bacterium]
MRRTLKIGGSLLRDRTLATRLTRWLDGEPPAQTIAIVGGGELIDAMRGLDATHQCDPEWIHWRCVDLLRVTFELLGEQLLDWKTISSRAEFDALKSAPTDGSAYLLAVDSFYFPNGSAPLPENWSTTTDAIAGWLSIVLSADELVLLKSCDVPVESPIEILSRQGIVDEALPSLAERLCPIRYINFSAKIDLP